MHQRRKASESLLMWECGLKLILWSSLANLVSHSLCGSVDWNLSGKAVLLMTPVTPYVGVWIETVNSRHNAERNGSHSLCGSVDWNLKGVNEIYNLLESLLMWECGLKHDELAQTNSQTPSLLMWECGLKQPWDIILEYHRNVTPYVGVWIETVTGATRIM